MGNPTFYVSTNPNTQKKNLRPIASLEIMTSYLECQTEAFSNEFGRHTYVRRVFKCFIYKHTFNLLLLNRNRVTLCLPGNLHSLSSADFVPKLLFFSSNFFRNTTRVKLFGSRSGLKVGQPDLVPNSSQRLTAVNTSRQ